MPAIENPDDDNLKDLREVATVIIEAQARAYNSPDYLLPASNLTFVALTADVARLNKKNTGLTSNEIHAQLRLLLVVSMQLRDENKEQWHLKTEGAMLEGRLSILREVLDIIGRRQCTQCQCELQDQDRFCGQCGAATEE